MLSCRCDLNKRIQAVEKHPWFYPATVFIVSVAAYLLTMPLTVALEDDGLFILSSYYNGVSHAPGYPLHSLLGHAFTNIPLSTVAARVHALSSVFAALTCLILWVFINDLVNNRLISFLAAMAYAFSLTFWSQSIVAEVYTLNTFFFFIILYFTYGIYKLENSSRDVFSINRLVYLSAFTFGLSLSNHWPLMVLTSPCFAVLIFSTVRRTPFVVIRSTPFFLIGLTPYIWMVINSQTDPFISFMGPINNWSDFYDFLSRKIYSAGDSSSSADLIDKLRFLIFYFREFIEQFTYIGVPLILTGIFVQFKYIGKTLAFALMVGFFCNIFLIIGLLDFDYDLFHQSIIKVYFLVSYGISAIWMAFGLYFIYRWLQSIDSCCDKSKKIYFLVASLLPVFVFTVNSSANNRNDYEWGAAYANTVLWSLPEGAILILRGDISLGTIGYMHFIEGVRPDLKVITDTGLVFSERMYDPFIMLPENVDGAVEKYISDFKSPVYSTSYDADMFRHDYWLTRKYESDVKKYTDYAKHRKQIIHINGLNNDYLNYIFNYNARADIWTQIHRNKLLMAAVPYVLEISKQGKALDFYEEVIAEVASELKGYIIILDYFIENDLVDMYGGLDKLLKTADELYVRTTDKQVKGEYLNFRASLELKAGNKESSKDYFMKSVDVWKNINNPSFTSLAELHKEAGSQADYNKYLSKAGSEFVEKYGIKR